MSEQGMKLVTSIFSQIQETRQKLLTMGTEGTAPIDCQDLMLSVTLGKMADSVIEEFESITTI